MRLNSMLCVLASARHTMIWLDKLSGFQGKTYRLVRVLVIRVLLAHLHAGDEHVLNVFITILADSCFYLFAISLVPLLVVRRKAVSTSVLESVLVVPVLIEVVQWQLTATLAACFRFHECGLS